MEPSDPRTTEALHEPPRALVRECRITQLATHEVRTFAQQRFVIGADPSADLVIDDPALSRFHCEIRTVEGAAFVRDLGSRNGTHVDRVPVLEAPLRDGALLTLGRSELRFDIGSRQVEIPLSSRTSFGRLVGSSLAMRATFALLEAAAGSASTVLLQGESGSGKDLAAEAIHHESGRTGPFIVVDCAAIPAHLLEAELFGHEAGAFTGASSMRIGAFEAAHGGTLFLDEIGELALDLQPKLLRAIDRREIQRLGSTTRITTDVRIVAATNRNLRADVNTRQFRSDLYYRLAVLVVTLPPLRERTADLPLLVASLLDDFGARDTEMGRALSGPLLPELVRHGWPGNVRELRNYVETCLARQEHAELIPGDTPTIDISKPLRVVRDTWVRHIERLYLEAMLAHHKGNVSAAARSAGVDRVHLHRLLARAGLR